MEYMWLPLKRYFEFTGRSRRKEFWMFALLNIIVYVVLIILAFGTGGAADFMTADPDDPMALYSSMFGGLGILIAIWGLATFIPSIAVSVRRLHDRDMSGWWYLGVIVASLIPFVGALVSIGFLILMALPGTEGPNRFGQDPKGGVDPTVFD